MESKIDVVFTSEHLQYKTESKQLKPEYKKKCGNDIKVRTSLIEVLQTARAR